MAEPVAPVESEATRQSAASSRVGSEALSLGLDIVAQGGGSKALALQMRALADLSNELVEKAARRTG